MTAQPRDGRQIFRFDTFGDEQLWTETLQMHTVVPSLSPRAALGLGLKVDVEALQNPTTFPVVIPPAYGLRGVEFETFTGDGSISYWNAYVGITQMGGHGDFDDPRIPLTIDQDPPDLVTPKLPALLAYQLSLRAPDPPKGSFNVVTAQRGRHLFNGQARCDACHTPPHFTDVLRGSSRDVPFLHSPSET